MDSWMRLEKEWPSHSDVSTAEILERYETWDAYDKDMSALDYKGAVVLGTYVAKVGLGKDARIFDLGCGTGLVGLQLRDKHGFTAIDGHDGSAAMLEKAKQQGIYQNYICCVVGNGACLPQEANTYDAVVTAGGASPGHFPLDTFDDLIRIIKPGGYLVHTCRAENLEKEQHRALVPYLKSLVAQGKLQEIFDDMYDDYYTYKNGRKIDGRIQGFRVTKAD